MFDDKIGRKLPVGSAGKNDARVGSEPHAKDCREEAVVLQSQPARPIAFAIDEVGCHLLQPFGHNARIESSDDDDADQQ